MLSAVFLQAGHPSVRPVLRLDFLDFISVERVKEKTRRELLTTIGLSHLEATDGQLNVGAAIAICRSADPRIRKLISVNISKTVQDRDILSMEV